MRADRQKRKKKKNQIRGLIKLLCTFGCGMNRADDKMASEYKLEGGATLHLVLALRGGVV